MMFNLTEHQHQYQYDGVTLIEDHIPRQICYKLLNKVKTAINQENVNLVNHEKLGTKKELDGGGKYLHHIFLSEDVKKYTPEIVGIYHSLVPLVSLVTCTDTVVSPYEDSDINIKAYPKGGGTIGAHYDTNGITVLLYLTDNTEGELVLEKELEHPEKGTWTETRSIYAKSGMLLLMKGREIWHWSKPVISENKVVVVLNYYQRGDTWRPNHFDDFVYRGNRVEH